VVGPARHPVHLTEPFRDHLISTAQSLVPTRRGALTRYTLNDRVMAVSLCLLTSDMVGGYLYGADPELRKSLDVTSLMARCDLALGAAHGAGRYSMLRGEENGKRRWRPHARRNSRVLLTRPGVGHGHLAAMATLLRWSAGRNGHNPPG
jgi:hypothetical protein